MSLKTKSFSLLVKIFFIFLIFLSGAVACYFYFFKIQKVTPGERALKEDIYLAFLTEVYETIQENYWGKISDEELSDLFIRATEKLIGQPQDQTPKDKAGLKKHLEEILKQVRDEEKKKEFVSRLADIVLANLKPFGRSRLYTKKEEKALSNNVKNISGKDYYQVLGLEKGALQEEIEQAYLKAEKTEGVEYAYRVLADPDSRKIYDETGAEPTIDYKLLRPRIFYLKLKKFSPTSLEELKNITEKVDTGTKLDTLIFDLRDNIGGSIDLLPYFLGPFIGEDQYAYQFLHQDKKEDFKTRTGWLASLVRYKKVVILVNENTQSSAEVVAATLKKYNVGVLLGTKTRGWGSIEKVFPLKKQIGQDETYSIFLVHSLTLRDDGQVIEGNGVEPLINLEETGWEEQLLSYFNYQELIEAIREVL